MSGFFFFFFGSFSHRPAENKRKKGEFLPLLLLFFHRAFEREEGRGLLSFFLSPLSRADREKRAHALTHSHTHEAEKERRSFFSFFSIQLRAASASSVPSSVLGPRAPSRTSVDLVSVTFRRSSPSVGRKQNNNSAKELFFRRPEQRKFDV